MVTVRASIFQNGELVQSVDYDNHPEAVEVLLDRGYLQESEEITAAGLQENFRCLVHSDWTGTVVWLVE